MPSVSISHTEGHDKMLVLDDLGMTTDMLLVLGWRGQKKKKKMTPFKHFWRMNTKDNNKAVFKKKVYVYGK